MRLGRTLAAGGAGAALALGRRAARRATRRARYAGSLAEGLARRTAARIGHEPRSYDDVTLARKVETEIFRPEDAPKGRVSVSARDGIVELRGQLERREQIDALVQATEQVEGVVGVDCLLHTPDEPAPHAAPVGASAPQAPRRRASATSGGPMLDGTGPATDDG